MERGVEDMERGVEDLEPGIKDMAPGVKDMEGNSMEKRFRASCQLGTGRSPLTGFRTALFSENPTLPIR